MYRSPRLISAGAAAAALVMLALGGCSDDEGGLGPEPGPTSRTLRVPEDFATVRDAVAAAAAGDTVQLAAGSYSTTYNVPGAAGWIACVYIQKPLTLRGAGANNTVIGGNLATTAIFVKLASPGTVRIERLTAEIRINTPNAKGITALASSRLEVVDCVVRGTDALDYRGLGVASGDSSTLQMRGSSLYYLDAGVLIEEQAIGDIARCTFERSWRSVIVENEASRATITDCGFSNSGDGVVFDGTSSCNRVERCVFQNMFNFAIRSSFEAEVLVLKCTIVNCYVALSSPVPPAAGSFEVVNSIVSDNYALFDLDEPAATFKHSCIRGVRPAGTDGGGNISAPPLFVDQFAGNLSLQEGSPCIDQGALSHQWECAQVEMTFTEFVGPAPDMGAAEQ